MNILSCVGFEKLCNVIKDYPEIIRNFVKECITFPLSYSSRAIQWQNIYLNELQTGVYQIDTKT